MKTIKILLVTVIFFYPGIAYAGAWTQKSNDGFGTLRYIYYETSHQFDRDGKKDSIANDGEYRKQSINLYFEHGLTDWLTMTGNFFYDFLNYKETQIKLSNNGLSDQTMGLRCRILKEPVVVSIEEAVKAPAGYSENKNLPLGNAQVDLGSWLLLGKSFGKDWYACYANFELGYTVRFEEPPDALKWQVMLGYKGIKNTSVAVSWNATRSIGSGKEARVNKNLLALVDYDLDVINMSLGYSITPRISINANYFIHVAGKNTGGGSGFGVGATVAW